MDKISGMRRSGADPRVRKTLVRHSQQLLASPDRHTYTRAKKPSTSTGSRGPLEMQAMGDMKNHSGARIKDVPSNRPGSSVARSRSDVGAQFTLEEKHLDEPKLCSSLALHEYIEQLKISQPAPLGPADLRENAEIINKKVTKQLNFPFHEAIYKNLVQLNGASPTTSHTSKPPRRVLRKRYLDLEPKEDDFFPDEEVHLEVELPPSVLKCKPIVVRGDVGLYEVMKSFEGDPLL